MLIIALLSTPCLAGYGDAVDGLPTPAEREMHSWTNMVRVDPASFAGDYDCSFESFQASEKTPKDPLMWNLGLNEAANYHSGDMLQYDYFDHDSIDGTSWSSRIHRYYDPGTIGENIAWGYGDVYEAVIEGWMCSSGHRANIMKDSYDEMGPGVAERYYTQDFGYGGVPIQPIAMGSHMPTDPDSEVRLVADFHVAEGVAPVRFEVVVDGEPHALELIVGTEDRGAWWTSLPAGDGCQLYYFEVEVPSGQTARFPEDGSYGWGDCSFDDPDARWSDTQIEPADDQTTDTTEDDDETTASSPQDDDPASDETPTLDLETGGCGCATSPPTPALLFLLPLLLIVRSDI